MPGLLDSHGDHTPSWTISAQQGHVAWRCWFHWGCGASSGTSPVVESPRVCVRRRLPARNARRTLASQQQDTGESHSSVPPSQSIRSRHTPDPSRCTRYVAKHPLRSDTPDQKGCNAYGSGAPPPTTSPTAGNSPPQTPTVRPGRSHTASTYSPRLRTRGAAPVRERYTPSELV